METGNNCKCLLEVMKEAHVEIGTAFRPTVETDVKPQFSAGNLLTDIAECKYEHNPLLESEYKSDLELTRQLAATKPLDPIVRFSQQSGVEVGTPSEEEKEQNVLFKDQVPGYEVDIESPDDPTRTLQDTGDVSLENFFERPVKIFDDRWGTGTNFNADFNPWHLFFTNKRVVNRVSNYNLLRCKLHLKFVINGNGFQYGRLLAAYHPLFDGGLDQASTHAALIPQDLVQTSQLPHIFLDPTTSTGGEMHLPFFWHKNNVSITSSDLQVMGRIFLRTINGLRHANDAPDVANISVFAWATDVQLNVLTSRNASGMVAQSGYEPQSNKKSKKTMSKSSSPRKKSPYTKQEESGKEVDEANHTGMVSGPATAIMKAANMLSIIPQIAPFAMATSKVAGTVATVAKALGYSRPTETKNPDPIRPTPTSQLATTNTPDTAIKLTVDEKQELTIDPAIAGIGSEDPMCIKAIASRETYLTTFNWNIGTAREALLWNARVEPTLWRESGSTPTAFHFPACCMAALPFTYWTGTMKFRFQIVSSIFHKGRLRISYDPRSLSTADHEYNVNYLEVVDIAEAKDFTIEIGNGREFTLLDHDWPTEITENGIHGTNALTTGRGNGTVSVHVLNELTTPSALSAGANDIQVNVYISMGDDFEVFTPDNFPSYCLAKPTPASSPEGGGEETMGIIDSDEDDAAFDPAVEEEDEVYESQSGTESALVPDSENTDAPSAPEQTETCQMGVGVQDTTMINKVFTGEAIVSFRPMLKRYNLWRRETVANNVTQEYYSVRTKKNNFPMYRGAVPGAVDYSDVGPYNYVNSTLIHWLVLAHQGWRGSLRYKIVTDTGNSTNISNLAHRIYIERDHTTTAANYSKNVFAVPNYDHDRDAARTAIVRPNILTGAKGMIYANSDINPNVEFEVPWYSRYRFSPGKQLNYTGATAAHHSPTWNMDARMWSMGKSSMDYFVATGEDFQVYFWTGLPRMYFEAAPPFTEPPP